MSDRASSSSISAPPPPPTLAQRLSLYLHERSAVPLAAVLTLLIGAIDAITGADITVNFLYQVPIYLAAWFKRWTGAAMIIFASMTARAITMTYLVEAGPRLTILHTVWNLFAETAAFALFALFVIALRDRARETQSRLIATTEQLRHAERLTTLGKLAAGVAHELGTPLHVVMLRAEALGAGKLSGEQTATAAKSIIKQSEKMTTILEQLLHFGRRAAATRTRSDLRELAREAAQLVHSAAMKRQVQIKVEEQTEPVWAEINFPEMEQVISNLLLNAVQASPRGAAVRVEVGQRGLPGEGGGVHAAFIAVSDHGSGISPENLPHIFDPFFTTKQVGEGTGLGLSVSFGIVNDHGGRIDVESRKNEGCTFTVLLPA